MKKSIILLFTFLVFSPSFIQAQSTRDSNKSVIGYPQFSNYFTEEESWELHREAYQKKLEAKGLSKKEVAQKMSEYEAQKEELILRIKEQRKLAAEQRKLAEIQRAKAKELRKAAEVQRAKAADLRKLAEEQRRLSQVQREQAHQVRLDAAKHRKEAERLREIASKQRKIAEELRKSIQTIYRESIHYTSGTSEEKLMKIKVDQKNTLFINIDGVVREGSVLIELFDPKGKKEGELSLEHRKSSNSQKEGHESKETTGNLNRTINSSITGEWLVKITAKKTESNINVSVAQRSNINLDE